MARIVTFKQMNLRDKIALIIADYRDDMASVLADRIMAEVDRARPALPGPDDGYIRTLQEVGAASVGAAQRAADALTRQADNPPSRAHADYVMNREADG